MKVVDNGGLAAMDTIQISVNNTNPSNRPPLSNAGPDQTVNLPTSTVNLDGRASTDPDNNITNYSWSKISGPSSYNFANANAAQAQVTNLVAGEYKFELNVTDAGGLFDKDTMQVTVNPDPNNPVVNVYVAGMENNLPAYWKNGQMMQLDNISYGFTGTSIAVVGNDIYVAGTKNELMRNDYSAKYWKNGQAVLLGDAAGASSIVVRGVDVYVAGWKWVPTGSGAIAVANYWKNGQAVSLSDGTKEAYANCMILSGSDIYVAGQEAASSMPYSNYIAKYWKNGVAVLLTSASSDAVANSITVVGNDVYVAGYENGIAKYWKNGQDVSLSQGIATSIVVVGSDVYVAGYHHQGQGNSIAKYWKNGQEVTLTSGSEAFATSIAVFGSDVYVAGFEINFPSFTYTAKYWKNGQAIPLSSGGIATSIVVVN
ncbi:MAG TPA: PKD domain-containing protein [Chitinophagaceae bacterium]